MKEQLNKTDDLLKEVISILSAISTQLKEIENTSKIPCILSKEHWTVSDCSAYTGISENHIYRIPKNLLPRLKPGGKTCWFRKVDIFAYLESNEIKSDAQIEQEALSYTLNKSKAKPP
jgi:hypothetical protein